MSGKRQGKILLAITALLLAGLALLLSCSWAGDQNAENPAADPKEEKLLLYSGFSSLSFEGGGEEKTISLENPGTLAVIYWASWCPHCEKAMEEADALARAAAEEGARLVLINKLDGARETWDSAENYLLEKGVRTENWFDEGAKSYEALGLSYVPTALVFDGENRLMAIAEGRTPDAGELRSMIRNAALGNAARMMAYVKEHIIKEDGGVISGYSGEVLSESLGLLMLAATAENDAPLFEKLYGYVESHKTDAGLASWKDSSPVNALVDDLRIYKAMYIQGIGEKALKDYADAIWQGNVQYGFPVDFFDAEHGQKARRFTLCYGDIDAFDMMAKSDPRWKDVRENALRLIENGMISSEFPLFHSWYDYDLGKYRSDSLNMAEAMLTLLHLSRAGKLPGESLDWLEARMAEGYIYGRYDVDGRPSKDGLFESTAVYALLSQVALSENRPQLAQMALTRMDELRVKSTDSAFDGAFGEADGSGIHSFDQLTALLAYQAMEGAKH